MATILSDTKRTINEHGTLLEEVQNETVIYKNTEPDYVKIYTNMWFEFKQFPQQYRELFFQLAIRMSYCSSNNLKRSQIVSVVGDIKDEIVEACGWKTANPLVKGLKALCDCGAIRRTQRGCYQINPDFAGKGPWRYDPKSKRGGVKDLVTAFRFSDKTVETVITYEDDEDDQVYAAASQSELDVIASMSDSSTPTDDDPESP